MTLPRAVHPPPFDITRTSHVVLNVNDLTASRKFYEELLGLVMTSADADVAYLRGVEEACHHSLVLRRADTAVCRRVGLRVRDSTDLDCAETYFSERGLTSEWVDVPHQQRTLHAVDDSGIPLELCAGMPTQPRQALHSERFEGPAALGLDHVQVLVPEINRAVAFYAGRGFRVTGYASRDGSAAGPFRSVFMTRKGNANDLVLVENGGPSLHHLAYIVADPSLTLNRVCDLAAAMGWRDAIEWGPGRHGLGYEQFLYLLDPDGHRIELLGHPYQFIDLEEEPEAWSADDPNTRTTWGPAPPKTWFEHASSLVDESGFVAT